MDDPIAVNDPIAATHQKSILMATSISPAMRDMKLRDQVRVVDHSMRATNSERGYTPQLLGDLTQGDGGWSPPVLRTRKDIYFHFGPM